MRSTVATTSNDEERAAICPDAVMWRSVCGLRVSQVGESPGDFQNHVFSGSQSNMKSNE
jgi:hypothetical protein